MLLSSNLEAFLQVCETGTVHLAAKKLSITQTAATQRIKNLEKKLEVCLFIRSRKGMQLTDEGKHLLRYCHQANQLGSS